MIHQPLQLKSITLKNRIGMSPMCMYSAHDGFSTDWHYVHYGTRAVGEVGLIIVEATAVAPEGRITPFDLGLWKNEQIPPLKKIIDFVHKQGSVAGIQLAHAGRKASHDKPANGGKQLSAEEGGWETVGPSPLPFDMNETAPLELTKEQIKNIVNQFAQAASRAYEAGFKLIEIHAAHGYLLHEFLSPLSNLRTDEYGGSFVNRIRFLLEVIDAVKKVWPKDLPIFVRLSTTEWTDGGWTLEDTVKLAKTLIEAGVDLIDCSSGGNLPHAKIPLKPGYQIEFAEALKKNGVPASTVGLITTEEEINNILSNKQADLVLLGRELLRNPYFVLQTKQSAWPDSYKRSKITD